MLNSWQKCAVAGAGLALLTATLVAAGALAVVRPRRLRILYETHFADRRRERLLIASASFFVAFGVVRSIAYSIHRHHGPFHDVAIRGVHVHHLVFGVALLMLVGYLWLMQVGTGGPGASRAWSCLTALFFGIGSALTLDELALWLHLSDVYWARQGRESVDAVMLFGALLLMGVGGGAFVKGLVAEVLGRPARK